MLALKKNGKKDDSQQLNLFDTIIASLGGATSSEIAKAISTLQDYHNAAVKREENERKKLEEIEAERKRREAKEKEDAFIEGVTSMELPMDWENAFNSDARVEGVHADSPSDALILSLTNLGKVDIEYISAVCGQDLKSVILALKGSIYQNPLRPT